jgi:hypothetical protein
MMSLCAIFFCVIYQHQSPFLLSISLLIRHVVSAQYWLSFMFWGLIPRLILSETIPTDFPEPIPIATGASPILFAL